MYSQDEDGISPRWLWLIPALWIAASIIQGVWLK